MQKYMYGLMLAVSLHQNGFAMEGDKYVYFTNHEISSFKIRAVPFLQEVLKDKKLLERVGALLYKNDEKTAVYQVQNNIYRMLGEFALNRGAIRVSSDDALHTAQMERELVCLRLLKEPRAIYCAVNNVKNDDNPESILLLLDEKTTQATDEIYTRLARYTEWLITEHADYTDRK